MSDDQNVAPAQPEKWLQEWVYIGITDASTGPAYHFQRIEDGKLGMHWYMAVKSSKKSMAGTLHVGSVYSVEANDTSAWLGTKKYLRLYEDQGQRAAWQARERVRETLETAKKREARETDENALKELLRPLRREYAKTNWRGQRALELVVLDALRSRITDEDT